MDNTNLANITGSKRVFDDPFLMLSSDAMPDTISSVLDFAMFLYYLNPQFRQASSRVVSHFITDIDYEGDASGTEKAEFDDYMHYQLKVMLFMTEMGDELSCYGNAFARIHFPFDRVLYDARTSTEYALDMFGSKLSYNYRDMTYEVEDPKNKKAKIRLPFRDRKSLDAGRIVLRKLNPRHMILKHNPVSGSTQFVYRFETSLIDDVKKSRLHIVNELPMAMLKAIKDSNDFLFADDTIFHLKAPTISGISDHGWGLPSTIANFRNIYQLQVYRKIDEAVGMDYMLPFRLFSPLPQQSVNEGINNILMSRWGQEIGKVIDNRRRDKFAMHALPFPVNYQEIGYAGKEIAPHESVEYNTKVMLDGMGYPQELFSGTLQYVQMPTAVRLFENSFQYMHIGFNQLLQWVVRRVRGHLGQPKLKVELQRPAIADSIERKQMLFQLASAGEVSRETAWQAMGIDNVAGEFKKRIEEDAARQRLQRKMEQEIRKEVELGIHPDETQDGAPGSSPDSQAGMAAVTPMDMQGQAQGMAEYWLSIQSDGERRSAMEAARAANPELHALAKEKMAQMRGQGASQGRAAVSQQAQQTGV